MKNKELIKVLRYCGQGAKGTGCYNCPIYHEPTEKCFEIMTDAADALEEAEKQIEELEEEHNKTVTAIFWEEQLLWENRCKELEAERMELTAKCRRLEARLPKEGEWIEADDLEGAIKGRVFCSNCKNPFESIVMTNEKIILTNQKTNYCPCCGAKIDGVVMNDEQTI